MKGKRVLVTGGTGFVGANLVRSLLAEGHEVHLLVRPQYQSWRIEEIVSDLRVHEASLLDSDQVQQTIAQVRPEWIFHLAANGAYSWQQDVMQILETNLMGTVHLLQACIKSGFEVFVNTGSSSEYGFKDHAPDEREWLEPNSHYAVAKASATLFCRFSAEKFGLRIPTLRLYSVFGPYEEPSRLIPKLVLHGFAGEFPPLVAPDTARDFIFVDDVCRAYFRVAEVETDDPGAVFNVGTGWQTTIREAADTLRRILNLVARPEFGSMEGRVWDSAVWVANPDRIGQALGWSPRLTFAEGLQHTIDWFRANPLWLAHYRKTVGFTDD